MAIDTATGGVSGTLTTPLAEWVINDVLHGKRGGYFVEAGAAKDGSNTAKLEQDLGWTGLLVEPHPGNYEILKSRRNCAIVNGCLAETASQVEFVMNNTLPGTSGIASELSEHVVRNFYNESTAAEKVQVTGYPLALLLRQHGAPKRIDFFCLDVEGAEWLVLKNFPFDEFSFSCMTIERGSRDYQLVRKKLLEQGYRLVKVGGCDDFWTHPSIEYRPSLGDAVHTSFKRVVQTLKAGLTSSTRAATAH
jgi:FkbM family methyltransferase